MQKLSESATSPRKNKKYFLMCFFPSKQEVLPDKPYPVMVTDSDWEAATAGNLTSNAKGPDWVNWNVTVIVTTRSFWS